MKTYTTVKGNQLAHPLPPKIWEGIKRIAARRFDGSRELFESCWRVYRKHLQGSIDNPGSISDVSQWLESIASEKVNNPKSKFYIHG